MTIGPRPSLDPTLLVAAILATCVPTLLAYNRPPSATALNQCLAVALWGLMAAMTFTKVDAPRKYWRQLGALIGAIGLVAAAALGSWAFGTLPLSLALQAVGLLAGAALLAACGASAARSPNAPSAFCTLAIGLLLAGMASSAVGIIQVYAPAWIDGDWIGQSAYAHRAVGNLRQPNHFCTLLQWSLIAAVALHEMRWLPRAALWTVTLVLVWAIQLSTSRTGAAGFLLLLGWAILDRRLSRSARFILGATPVLYAMAFGVTAIFDSITQTSIGDSGKLMGASGWATDNSRFGIWRSTLDMIATQPWTGVGFGEFNFAWTLTPIANRAPVLFDNCHNFLLQLAVELGIPGAVMVTSLLLFALWQSLQQARRSKGPAGIVPSAGLMIVLIIGLHSMVEFPLWYAYFLFPAALAWGFALGAPSADSEATIQPPTRVEALSGASWGLVAGLLMSFTGAWSLLDYQRVILIYTGQYSDAERSERIEQGQRSLLFAHQADYTAALSTTSSPLGRDLGFVRGIHVILDSKMMLAWARKLAAQGQVDPARWVLQRMREFHTPDVEAYFAPCKEPSAIAFQCEIPVENYTWRNFAASK